MVSIQEQEQLEEYYAWIARNMAITRQMTEGNPRDMITTLAGDDHLGGPLPGLLDALARGILKETGNWGKEKAARQKRIHAVLDEHRAMGIAALEKELGHQPSAGELAGEDCYNLQLLLRAFTEDHYADDYPRRPSVVNAHLPPADSLLPAQADENPMYG